MAEELVQTRGLNAMSYGHVSARVGITNASLHYHFPAKADLTTALVTRYSERFFASLDEIERTKPDVADRLRAYAQIYAAVLASGRMCLCGMLASDFETLSPAAQDSRLGVLRAQLRLARAHHRRGGRRGSPAGAGVVPGDG